MKSLPCCLVPACAIALCCGIHRSYAQALELGIGLYSGVTRNATNVNPGSSQWQVTEKRLYLIGLQFNGFYERERTSRLGLRYILQSATAEPRDRNQENDALRDGITYRMHSLALNYQRKLYDQAQLAMIFDFAAGASFISSRLKSGLDYCDTPFCHLPEVRLNLSAGILYMLKLNRELAVEARGSYYFLPGGSEDTSPFRSGFILAVGMELENTRK